MRSWFRLRFKQRPELEQAVLTLKNQEISLKGATQRAAADAGCIWILWRQRAGRRAESDLSELLRRDSLRTQYVPNSRLLHGAAAPGEQLGAGQGRGLYPRTFRSATGQRRLTRHGRCWNIARPSCGWSSSTRRFACRVVNAQFALRNDRAQVVAARAAHDYAQQSLDAENKRLSLGASTAYNVLLQQKNLATSDAQLISAEAAYARDRAGCIRLLRRRCSTTASTSEMRLPARWRGPGDSGITPAKDTGAAMPGAKPSSR